MIDNPGLQDQCAQFLEEVTELARQHRRDSSDISVVAVSKTRTLEEVSTVVAAGIKFVGENRVQEAVSKFGDQPRDFELHMIGHLQSNKAKQAIELFNVIQSVDSLKLAAILNQEYAKLSKLGEIMLEINTSGEPQKFGFVPQETPSAADKIFEMQNLTLTGLMTVGPLTDDESLIRESFRQLRKLFEKVKLSHPRQEKFKHLSMGMSDDYELAIQEGSTMIRIGRAIFGPRTA